MTLPRDFAPAARDYRFLIDKGYPIDASVKLVGDRYRLDKAARIILFRGILPGAFSASNAARIIGALPPAARVAVDGYNILFTVMNHLRGHPLFIATDGLLRDAGGAHGRIADPGQFLAAADLLCDALARLGVASAALYLDAPISRSADHAAAIREILRTKGLRGETILVPGADGFVAGWDGDAIATSDSAIVSRARAPVFDLARHILENRYCAEFIDLSDLLRAGPA